MEALAIGKRLHGVQNGMVLGSDSHQMITTGSAVAACQA
jgi:hypothetical protein